MKTLFTSSQLASGKQYRMLPLSCTRQAQTPAMSPGQAFVPSCGGLPIWTSDSLENGRRLEKQQGKVVGISLNCQISTLQSTNKRKRERLEKEKEIISCVCKLNLIMQVLFFCELMKFKNCFSMRVKCLICPIGSMFSF